MGILADIGKTTFGMRTLSIMALCIMTLSIITFNVMDLIVTVSMKDTQHNEQHNGINSDT